MDLPQPYIGITGIVSPSDVDIAHECAKIVRDSAPTHRLMTGVLVSYKTLFHKPTTNRRYPAIGAVDKLLEECNDFGAWPVVHYNSHATGEEFAEELEHLYYLCPAMRGLQLNVVTPDPETVRYFANKYPEVEVILQINGSSLKATGLTPLGYVQTYRGVRHALLDASGGTGKVFAYGDMLQVLLQAYEPLRDSGIRIGLAGGLGSTCGVLLRDLVRGLLGSGITLRDLSFDAESGIRVSVPDPIAGEGCQDQLDHDRAVEYVRAVCMALR